jgi:hypothetical protein
MLSMSAITAWCSGPVTKTFGSLNARDGVPAGCDEGAGVGVAGTAAAVPDEPAAGAAGGAGVAADLAAGVAGAAAAAAEEEADAAAGLGLGQRVSGRFKVVCGDRLFESCRL